MNNHRPNRHITILLGYPRLVNRNAHILLINRWFYGGIGSWLNHSLQMVADRPPSGK
jgi:hypothetical protein